MKAISLIFALGIACAILVTPVFAFEQTLNGHLEGLYCIYAEKLCAIDNLDPHIALELDFVLLMENDEHYLLINVPREVKIQYYGKNIEVTGDVREEYRAVMVNRLSIKKGERYSEVWTSKEEAIDWREWQKRFYEKGSEN